MVGGKLIHYQNQLKWYTFIISFTLRGTILILKQKFRRFQFIYPNNKVTDLKINIPLNIRLFAIVGVYL